MKKPTIFGKYLLLERLNVGGMAEVFTAKAFGVEGFERILAIKKILPTMAEDEEFITMFIDEARISVQLNHANVVHIHELGKHDDAYFIAMEYVSGKDLRALLERFRRRREIMPTAMAVYVASKMCEGLDYAHRKKDARGQQLEIIHRDVSPQNILVSYEGEVKIIDFGIAKAANRSQKTQAGILKGKFGYMSPEQVRGLPIDRRSDVFAVGVTLYEMLTGEKLFVGESDFSTLEKVRNAEVPLPRQFNPNIPAGLEKVVMKSLAREAEDRYQWGSDLQEDLMRFLLAGDAIYSAKHLSTFMKEAFAEDLLREGEKMERYSTVKRPDDLEASGVTSAIKRKPTASQTAAAAPVVSAPPAAKRPSASVSVAAGSGAVAVGMQSAGAVNIPPPSAEELAEMDGAADRTMIVSGSSSGVEVDLKTSTAAPSPYAAKPVSSVGAPVRQQIRPVAPRPSSSVGNAATHDNLSPSALSALNQSSVESTVPPGEGVPDEDTGNDLKPIDMTGFRPAIDVDADGNEVGDDPNATIAPAGRPSRPKFVIGDAPVNGATTVGPSPLSSNDTIAPSSTQAYQVGRTGDDEGDVSQDDEAEGSEAEAIDEVESTAERPALKPARRATPAPRQPTKRSPAKGKRAGRKPGVVIAIAGLAVVALMVVAAAVVKITSGTKARLVILPTPKVPFTATISGKTYDGAKAIELEPGKYTVMLKPAAAGFGRQQFDVELKPSAFKQVAITLKEDAVEAAPPEPRAPPEQKPTVAPTTPEPSRPLPPEPTPVKPTAAVEPAPATFLAVISSNEPDTEISLDGKVRGKTPARVSDLQAGKVYKGLAKKAGFVTQTFVVENKSSEKEVRVDVELRPEAAPVRNDPPPPVVKKDPPPPREPAPVTRKDPPIAKVDAPKSSAKGRLRIASNPTKAMVFIDGKPTGRETPVLPSNPLEVAVGKHKLQFKLGGKMSAPIEVNVVEGDNPVMKGEIPQ
jgi:eukaryotic-like serine/threonine-protein kinase